MKTEWGGGSTGRHKLTDSISLQELQQMREDGLNDTEIAQRLEISSMTVRRYLGPNPLGTAEMRALRREREKEHPGRLAGFVPYERKRPERDKPEEAKPKPESRSGPGTVEVYEAVREALLRQMEKAAKLAAEAETLTRHTPALMMAAVEAARELRMWEEVRK